MRYFWFIVIIIAVVLVVGACSSPPSTPSTAPSQSSSAPPSSSSAPPTSSQPPTASTSSPAAGGPTFGQIADAGKTVFAGKCAKCHGNNGQGVTAPAVIGSSANLGKYNTAQGLLDFTRASMPFDAPGSLSSQDYANVLGFMLVQNNYVSPNTAFDANQLANVQLKK